jgi:hypothetical protein
VSTFRIKFQKYDISVRVYNQPSKHTSPKIHIDTPPNQQNYKKYTTWLGHACFKIEIFYYVLAKVTGLIATHLVEEGINGWLHYI